MWNLYLRVDALILFESGLSNLEKTIVMRRLFFALVYAALSFAAMAVTPASFPGGESAVKSFLAENMQYPSMARENGVEGVVTVCFTVNADGSLSDFRIKRMVDPDLEAEALRLAGKMPKWTPADDNGQPVKSTAELKIPFTLE